MPSRCWFPSQAQLYKMLPTCYQHLFQPHHQSVYQHHPGRWYRGFTVSASGPPSDPDNQSYEDAVAYDPIALCQSTVRAVHASCGQHDHLVEIADGNKKGWFKSTEDPAITIQVKQLQLVHDMKVRWDSLYFMINQFHKLHPVCLNSIIL